MSSRKWLISLTLLAFLVPATWAQNQTQTQAPTQTQTQNPTPAPTQTPGPTTKDPTDQPPQQDSPDANAPKTSQPIQQPDDSKVKHDGSEKDVDAIGNRKIGGRGLGNWYSLESEIRSAANTPSRSRPAPNSFRTRSSTNT